MVSFISAALSQTRNPGRQRSSRQATIVAAENVSGVTKVHDHLCWVGPMSGMYLNSAEDDRALRSPPNQ
jgi:hypothetical protein